MINDFISNLIIGFDNLLNQIGLYSLISQLLDYLDDFQSYKTTFQSYLFGLYFFFGKSLIIYIVTIFGVIVTVRIIMAVVHTVGQFVP